MDKKFWLHIVFYLFLKNENLSFQVSELPAESDLFQMSRHFQEVHSHVMYVPDVITEQNIQAWGALIGNIENILVHFIHYSQNIYINVTMQWADTTLSGTLSKTL